jgi:hypothetical protein
LPGGRLLVLALSGCATSNGTPAATTSGPPANAGGSWSGYGGIGATAQPVSLTLAQTGGDVKGDINVGGRPDLSGPVVGTVQGNVLSLRLASGVASLPAMTVTPSQITGVLSVGPMTLTRVK